MIYGMMYLALIASFGVFALSMAILYPAKKSRKRRD